jgi:uncharacterized RDD family membrane protein YckC
MDLSLYTLLWISFQYLVLRWHGTGGTFDSLLVSYISFVLMIFVEPLLLTTWGTTPGKAILGLKLRNDDGTKLSYGEGVARTFGVFADGYGYGVPIYNIVRAFRCYKTSEKGEAMPWDEGLEYRIRDERIYRWFVFALAFAAGLMLAYNVALLAQLPRHRGDLTAAAYAANVNDVLSRPDFRGYPYRMTETGQWVRYDQGMPVNVHFLMEGRPPGHRLTLSDGIVTAVSFEVESTADSWLHSYASQKHLMALAFMASQRELKPRELFRQNLDYSDMSSYTKQIGIVSIEQRAEIRGYWEAAGRLIPIEGEERYFHLLFSMQKTQ